MTEVQINEIREEQLKKFMDEMKTDFKLSGEK